MAFSIDRALAAEKAFNMSIASGAEEDGVTIPEVELMIDEAIKQTCDKIVTDKQFYRLHSLTMVTVTSGVGAIGVDVLAESIKESNGGRVTFSRTDTTDQPIGDLVYKESIASLKRPRPGSVDLVEFSIRGSGGGGAIYVYDCDATPCSGTASILAASYYDFDHMPSQLEDDFLMVLADMVRERIASGKGMKQEAS